MPWIDAQEMNERDEIIKMAEECNVTTFRGAMDDPLIKFYHAVRNKTLEDAADLVEGMYEETQDVFGVASEMAPAIRAMKEDKT